MHYLDKMAKENAILLQIYSKKFMWTPGELYI